MAYVKDAPKSRDMSALRQVLIFLWPHKLRLLGATAALMLTAGATLSLGYGVRILIDSGFSAGNQDGLKSAVLLLVGISMAMAFGTFVRFYLVSWLGERVSADLRSAVFRNLVRLHPGFFEQNQAGEIMSRLTTDTALLQTLIGSSVSLAARNTLTLVGALALMLFTNFKLSLFILLIVPLTIAPILIFGRKVRRLSSESQDSIASVGSYAGEVLQSIKVVQSFKQEGREVSAFDGEVDRAFVIAKRRIRQRSILMAVAIFLSLSGMTAMLWSGGNDVISGRMTAGDLGAFVFYAIMVGGAFATLSEVWGDLQRAAGAAERLLELLATTSQVPDEGRALPAPGPERVVFDRVGFFYPSRPDNTALDAFNLVIAPGKSLALVGPSGAGKSTVFELLQRFYDPQSGAIRYGDTDLRQFSLHSWRSKTALVPQNPVLFTGTVRDNIAYGKPDARDSDVLAAARAAHADVFIRELPGGFDCTLGAQGMQLSGGQRQRIALARAILDDPEILLLDEATSALDTESEYHVQQALGDIMRGRTTVIIAHRLSTIINADQIAVMDQGQVVATGTHEQLLLQSPLYKRLAELQFREAPLTPARSVVEQTEVERSTSDG
ncbi:ABC transporter, permease/ATP-binding protein [Luminiphilus syltensis NOR5-1B]|uniref:ABC transporter, permease/ATP-binding protein n=1 Tax=Luminiphilus syltensis NOR5-1B TaxID=565045 RepID=B8KUR5_9GAMM|nr:ABC transporter transmembrane domain-containing protein [Luminiphilus syltensis]EED36275.1 ABC transporter, permease/ATP-binding protein [Luminiphilus syltensis NOR5-1B]